MDTTNMYVARFSDGQRLALEERNWNRRRIMLTCTLNYQVMKANYSIPTNGLQIQVLFKQVALILWIIDKTFAVLTLMGQTGITQFHWPLESIVKFLRLEVEGKKVS